MSIDCLHSSCRGLFTHQLQVRGGTRPPNDAAAWQAAVEDALPSAPKARRTSFSLCGISETALGVDNVLQFGAEYAQGCPALLLGLIYWLRLLQQEWMCSIARQTAGCTPRSWGSTVACRCVVLASRHRPAIVILPVVTQLSLMTAAGTAQCIHVGNEDTVQTHVQAINELPYAQSSGGTVGWCGAGRGCWARGDTKPGPGLQCSPRDRGNPRQGEQSKVVTLDGHLQLMPR